MSLNKKIELTFRDLSDIVGFDLECNCVAASSIVESVHAICQCKGRCYCTQLHKQFLCGTKAVLSDDDSTKLVLLFRELEASAKNGQYAGVTMLDCADFIHRVKDKKEQFEKFDLSSK